MFVVHGQFLAKWSVLRAYYLFCLFFFFFFNASASLFYLSHTTIIDPIFSIHCLISTMFYLYSLCNPRISAFLSYVAVVYSFALLLPRSSVFVRDSWKFSCYLCDCSLRRLYPFGAIAMRIQVRLHEPFLTLCGYKIIESIALGSLQTMLLLLVRYYAFTLSRWWGIA